MAFDKIMAAGDWFYGRFYPDLEIPDYYIDAAVQRLLKDTCSPHDTLSAG